MKRVSKKSANIIVGWREWASLPDLGVQRIKVKVDTGARTSALHAYQVEPFTKDGQPYVRFAIHPLQRKLEEVVYCEARVLDQRHVSNSGGHTELRYVIETTLQFGPYQHRIEITLTNRDSMKFRMLLGRSALAGHYLVSCDHSYLVGQAPPRRKSTKPKP